MADVAEQIWGLVGPYVAAEGIELDDVEVLGGGKLLRVVVEADGPIEVDRIADLSRGIARLIESDDPFPGAYTLEVTSPGLERKLRRPAQFRKAVGSDVHIKTFHKIEDEKHHRGRLIAVDDDAIVVSIDGDERRIDMTDVASARTVFVWEKGAKPGKKA
ncbi:MAG: ribosome maturation factor RimP [Actinomycetota bacterium]|nr:ribosome maturation factor RimP [Actinomycetota bacterium]